MKLKILMITVMLFVFIACSPNQTPPKVWLVGEEPVYVEVENATAGGTNDGYWESIPDSIQGYSGETAFIWKGEGNMYKDPLVIDAPKTSGPYKLHYKVWVDEAGEYELKMSNYHWQEDGDNDAWISINRARYQKIWDHHTNEFTWSEAIANIAHYQPFPLHQGVNTIDIVGRSKNWIIDRFIIYKKDTPDSVWQDASIAHAELVAPKNPDNEAPELMENLKAMESGVAKVQLIWKPADDNFRVFCYEIFQNSEKITTAYDSKYIVPLLSSDTEYSFFVRAKDFSGNVSQPSNTITVETKPFASVSGLDISKTSTAPVIDAKLDTVWAAATIAGLDKKNGNLESDSDAAGSAKLLWDADYLYVFLDITDDLLNTDAGDGVHLDLDLDNSKTDFYSINDRRYFFTLENDRVKEVISRDDNVEGVQGARHLTGNGYQVEMAFPWETLGLEPREGQLIGLDIRLTDVDAGENTEAVLAWTGLGTSPQSLGTAKLQQ